jgi:type IV pilus assembly protein PilN
MVNINLLPWREQLREEKKHHFIIAMAVSTACALLMVFLIHLGINNFISQQEAKNQYLQTEINILDQQIKEIRNLREEKQQLLARMNIIQELQGGRPFVVHLFTEIVSLLPSGIYLESIKREADVIRLAGKAESNSQISQFMRRINASNWLTRPSLTEVKAITSEQQYDSDFQMQLRQRTTTENSVGAGQAQ